MDLTDPAPDATAGSPCTRPRRLRIAVAGASPCHACDAACCKQNGHAFAALLETDDERRRFRPWSTRAAFRDRSGEVTFADVLPYVAGRCVFLGDDDRCRVYDVRPRACRRFECTRDFAAHGPGRHGRFLLANPRVLDLLSSL